MIPAVAFPDRWCPRCQAPHSSGCPLRSFLQVQTDRARGTAHQRGYGAKWQKAAAAWLAKHPLCEECKKADRITSADCVDHVRPHRGDMKLFWDPRNWQSLCSTCHARKTRQGL